MYALTSSAMTEKNMDRCLPATLTFKILPHSEFSKRGSKGIGNFSECISQQSIWHSELEFLSSHLMFSANTKVERNVGVGPGIYFEF